MRFSQSFAGNITEKFTRHCRGSAVAAIFSSLLERVQNTREALLFLFVASLAIFSGCSGTGSIYSSYREVDQLHVVQTIGIDRSGGQTTLFISSGPSLGGTVPLLLSATSSSLVKTIDKIQILSPYEEMFYDHTQYGLIGEAAAKDGLSNYFDYFERSVQMRLNTIFFIIKDGAAKEIFSDAKAGDFDLTNLLSSIKADTEQHGYSWPYSGREITKSLSDNGSALVCAVEIIPTEGAIYSEVGEATVVPVGYAILKEARLCGYLIGDSARGANILLNRAGIGDLVIVTSRGDYVTLDFERSKTKIKPVWGENGLDYISVSADLEAGVVERSRPDHEKPESLTEEQFLYEVNLALNKRIYDMLSQTLQVSGNLQSDFLGLNRMLKRDSPEKFRNISADWPEILGAVEFKITTNATAVRSRDANYPVDIDGGGF